jgi:hypothetical protein
MKKSLLIYCFLFMTSCSMGTIEAVPEASKFLMQNKSGVSLLNVEWNNTNFGDIEPGRISERIVSDGDDYVRFETSNGKRYRTFNLYDVKKHARDTINFTDKIPVYNETDKQRGTLGDIDVY